MSTFTKLTRLTSGLALSYPDKAGAPHTVYLINHFGLYLPCVNIHIIQYVLHYKTNKEIIFY